FYMPTAAAQFFASVVTPTVSEFFCNPTDIRRGRLAAIVLYHMADYWFVENKTAYGNLTLLHETLIKQCPDFLIIRDVADASKHHRLTLPSKIPRALSSSDQVEKQKSAFEAPLNTTPCNQPSMLVFTLDDGTRRPLAGAIRSVLT